MNRSDTRPKSGSPPVPRVPSRSALWFGLLGGGLAWTLHLLAAYVIAEFGGVSGWGKTQFLGISGRAWLLLTVSLVALLGAVGAALVARRNGARLDLEAQAGAPVRGAERYMARAGVLAGALFILVILVESLPIFFYLNP